jgi:UDP-4-amino-4,6-dideoxy-N-acetyl-beta-L-altrosamine transaminase
LIPYGRQLIEDDDIAAVAEVLRGGYLTTGPAVERFERALADRLQALDAIACANGTAALHLASLALDLGPGDVVVVPAITFVATANAPAMTGARVVFADVDPETGLMRADHLEAAIEAARAVGRPRGLFAVHMNGQAAPMPELATIARAHNMAVVEDSCHAIGGTLPDANGRPTPVGSCTWADICTFSFHPVKTITTGEGGALTLADAATAARVRQLRGHGLERDPARFWDPDIGFSPEGTAHPWAYEMQALGHNYRASDVQCALGISQLGKLDRFVSRRDALVAAYDARLAELAPTLRPIGRVAGAGYKAAWHLYPVLIDFDRLGRTRAEVMHALRARDIGTQVHYIPVPWQPYWRRHRANAGPWPGAASYYARVLSLPLFAAMTDWEQDQVIHALAGLGGAGDTGRPGDGQARTRQPGDGT